MEKGNYNMKEFTCPNCQGHRLEEIMSGVTVASTVNSFEIEDGDISFDYGEQSNEDGTIDRYQCMDCGHSIANNPQ